MTFSDFERRFGRGCVVVFTGSRFLPDGDAGKVVRLGAGLARCLPAVRFRVGASRGANEAFCAGVSADHMPVEGEAMAVESVVRGEVARLAGAEVPLSPKYLRMAMDHGGSQRVSGRPSTRVLPREGIQVTGAPKVPPAGVVLAWVTPGQVEDVSTRNLRTVSVSSGVGFLMQDQWEGWFL
jgi:hypothetical protein